jgi:hypothetical protein
MNTTTATITPGTYRAHGVRLLIQDGRARLILKSGRTARAVVARLQDGELIPTGNAGTRSLAAINAVNHGEATQVAAHCTRCHAPLSDPASVRRGTGPECATK